MTVQPTRSATKTAPDRRRHPRWPTVLAASVLWVSACTGASEHHATPSTSGLAVTAGPAVAFDPPSRFDLARAVPLTEEQVVHGTLEGTTVLWVEDDTVRSVDLTDPGRSWKTNLPTGQPQDFLAPPRVVGDVVVAVTGEKKPTGGGKADDYAVNIVGASVRDGSVLWGTSLPVEATAINALPGSVDHWSGIELAEYGGDILMIADGPFDTAVRLDPASGSVRWRSDTRVALRSSGRQAVVVAGGGSYRDVSALDLDTGQVVALRDHPSKLAGGYVDSTDPTYIILILQEEGSEMSLRFSSVDGTIATFTPDLSDMRYSDDYYCRFDDTQPVQLCQTVSYPYSATGVDPASGGVVWTLEGEEDLREPIAFHGNLYGGRLGQYAVVDQQTGKTVTPDIGFSQVTGSPIKVNEYGAIGKVSRPGDPLTGRYAWAPASG